MTLPTVERVLLVHDYAGSRGGAELVVHDLRNALRARGVDARLLSSDADGPDPKPPSDYLFRGSTGSARALREVANPSLIRTARRVLAEFDPQVVHLGMFLTQVSPMILPLVADRAVVWVPNEFRPICPKGSRLLPDRSPCEHEVGRACLREGCFRLKGLAPRMVQLGLLSRWRGAVDRVVSPSRSFANDLARHGLQCDAVIPHPAPDLEASTSLTTRPQIGFAGRLVPDKGVDVLIRAMGLLRGVGADAYLTVLGDGPERTRLEGLVTDPGLGDCVDFVGHVTRDEVQRRLSGAWLQAVPSLWAEPFGLVTVEAMAREAFGLERVRDSFLDLYQSVLAERRASA